MPAKNVITPIETGMYYHIFNRGNNYENIFFRKQDYEMFIALLTKLIFPVSDIYAFALLPNHYHLLLRIKDDVVGYEFSHQFKRFILTYTNRINYREKRSGNLFLKMFKRLKVENEDYLKKLILYIHLNPYNHNITKNYKDYIYSSYKLFGKQSSIIKTDEVLDWFDNIENFEYCHNSKADFDTLGKLTLE